MSRELPARPNLEHLKKQAKDLLRDLQQHQPGIKLADAQHTLAREYGFSSWPALHAHVEAIASSVAVSPFTGTWTWTASHAGAASDPYRRVTVRFEVAANAVTIRDVTVDAEGVEHRTENTIQADGNEYAQPHGYALTARWAGARVLEAIGTKDGRVEGRVRYEVSDDGRTLTLSANDRVLRLTRALA